MGRQAGRQAGREQALAHTRARTLARRTDERKSARTHTHSAACELACSIADCSKYSPTYLHGARFGEHCLNATQWRFEACRACRSTDSVNTLGSAGETLHGDCHCRDCFFSKVYVKTVHKSSTACFSTCLADSHCMSALYDKDKLRAGTNCRCFGVALVSQTALDRLSPCIGWTMLSRVHFFHIAQALPAGCLQPAILLHEQEIEEQNFRCSASCHTRTSKTVIGQLELQSGGYLGGV